MLVLQSCTDSLEVMAGSSADTIPTSSDGTYGVGHMKVEEDVAVIEESLIFIKDEVDIDIKQEEIPEDIPFPGIKSEPDEVSYVCVCLLLDTFYCCPEMSFAFVMSVFMVSCNNFTVWNRNGWFFFCEWVGASVLDRLVCMLL
jgi:hypothetical protein